jgi:hypothetical protein
VFYFYVCIQHCLPRQLFAVSASAQHARLLDLQPKTTCEGSLGYWAGYRGSMRDQWKGRHVEAPAFEKRDRFNCWYFSRLIHVQIGSPPNACEVVGLSLVYFEFFAHLTIFKAYSIMNSTTKFYRTGNLLNSLAARCGARLSAVTIMANLQ